MTGSEDWELDNEIKMGGKEPRQEERKGDRANEWLKIGKGICASKDTSTLVTCNTTW